MTFVMFNQNILLIFIYTFIKNESLSFFNAMLVHPPYSQDQVNSGYPSVTQSVIFPLTWLEAYKSEAVCNSIPL